MTLHANYIQYCYTTVKTPVQDSVGSEISMFTASYISEIPGIKISWDLLFHDAWWIKLSLLAEQITFLIALLRHNLVFTTIMTELGKLP